MIIGFVYGLRFDFFEYIDHFILQFLDSNVIFKILYCIKITNPAFKYF